MLEEILYRLRVGCPWRDLPECLGFRIPVIAVFFFGQEKAINQTVQKVSTR